MVVISYQLKVASPEFQSVREYVGTDENFFAFIVEEMKRTGAYGFSRVGRVDLAARR